MLKIMFIANRLNKIKASPTLAMGAKAAELRAKGEDIIDLSLGESDFNTPEHIIEAAYQAMLSGKTRYTAIDGTPSLKDAIINKFTKENGLTYERKEITVGCGAKHVIFNAFMASLNEGDEVIIPAPYWVSYPDMVDLNAGKAIFIECTEKSNFKLTAESLKQAITDRTKWLIINSPSNPTGAVYSKEELKEIANVLLEHEQIWVLTDDIYEHLTYDDVPFLNILQVEPKLKNRTLMVNGASKAYAMTGWRIGYAAGPVELISAISKIQSHSTSNPCTISQYALEHALNNGLFFLDDWKEEYHLRRELACEILSESLYLTLIKPEGAFYVFVNCSAAIGKKTSDGLVINNDSDLTQYLLSEAKVATVLGAAFGLSPYFRISYVLDIEKLERGCRAIVEALKKLS